MSSDRPEQIPDSASQFSDSASQGRQTSNEGRDAQTAGDQGDPVRYEGRADDATRHDDASRAEDATRDRDTARHDDPVPQEATILVRGEKIRSEAPNSSPKDSTPKDSTSKDSTPKNKEKSPRKAVSAAKDKIRNRLPALDDDADVGVQKEQIVVRDGKADLAFTGTLVASAAPSSAPKGQWREYRVYETNAGKHVFSKVTRSVFAEDQDTHEAEVFDPSPSSVPSQLLRTARDLARSRPLTWMDAAIAFFGYDPLAKTLYRKLSGQFEEHIS